MPGILDRIRTILSANINAMLDKAENPEFMLQEYLRKAQADRGELREEIVEARAELIVLERRQAASEEQARKWGRRAEQAVREGDDQLAADALRRQMAFQEATAQWASQIVAQRQAVQSLEAASRDLTQRLEEAEVLLSSLISRHRAARATIRVEKVLQDVGEHGAPLRDFARMADKVDREEARAMALADMSAQSVEERFRALRSGDEQGEVRARLIELKQRLLLPAAPEAADEADEPDDVTEA